MTLNLGSVCYSDHRQDFHFCKCLYIHLIGSGILNVDNFKIYVKWLLLVVENRDQLPYWFLKKAFHSGNKHIVVKTTSQKMNLKQNIYWTLNHYISPKWWCDSIDALLKGMQSTIFDVKKSYGL